MTIETVFAQIEKYYGAYENQELKKFVRAYLVKDYNPDKFDEILRAILYYHKANFGAPCIATIEECIKLVRLEKGKVDPHKRVEVKNKWDYIKQQETNEDLREVDPTLFKKLRDKVNIKRV